MAGDNGTGVLEESETEPATDGTETNTDPNATQEIPVAATTEPGASREQTIVSPQEEEDSLRRAQIYCTRMLTRLRSANIRLVDAQAAQVKAETRLIEAEADRRRAETGLIMAESQMLRVQTQAIARQMSNRPQARTTNQVANQPWLAAAATAALVVAIIALGMLVSSWWSTQDPITSVASMFNGTVEQAELSYDGNIVSYSFKPETHSIQFPQGAQLFATVKPGWALRDKATGLTFKSGEKHFFPPQSGVFEAYRIDR